MSEDELRVRLYELRIIPGQGPGDGSSFVRSAGPGDPGLLNPSLRSEVAVAGRAPFQARSPCLFQQAVQLEA